MESLEGRDCYAGLDLSSTGDITALVLIFPPRDDILESVQPSIFKGYAVFAFNIQTVENNGTGITMIM